MQGFAAKVARLQVQSTTSLPLPAIGVTPICFETGEFCGLSDLTSLKAFVTTLAGHIAAEAARS
jgi:hypothetical protein